MKGIDISGTAAPGFERVHRAFEASFADRPDMGAALCIYVEGEPVVDLWGGVADARTGTPWNEATLNVVFSCTKGLVSILAAMLVQEGWLDYGAPVARYWPEFAAAGKSGVTVAQLLSHRAGLSAPRADFSFEDLLHWNRLPDALAAQAPLWPPGTGYSYHAITHGWLAGEVIRRLSGLSVGALFRQAVAEPLAADAWIGLPTAEHDRVAYLVVDPAAMHPVFAPEDDPGGGPDGWVARSTTLGGALPNPLAGPGRGFNDARLWSAEIPGAGGIASAPALARIWSATVCETGGVRLLEPETRRRAMVVQSEGPPVFSVPPPWPRWGMGFQLDSEARRFLTARSFGHDGAGGQVAFADPEFGVGFAFLTNYMMARGDTRATMIVDALRDVLADRH